MMTYTLTLSDFGQKKAVHIAFDGSNRIKPSMNEHKSPRSRHNLVSYRRYSCQESTKKLCIPGGSEQIIIWTMKPNKSVYNSLYPVQITVYIYYLDLSRRQLLRKSWPCVMPRLCILCKLQTWHGKSTRNCFLISFVYSLNTVLWHDPFPLPGRTSLSWQRMRPQNPNLQKLLSPFKQNI